MTMSPVFPGGTYAGQPTYQGRPYPSQPVVTQGPGWSPSPFAGNNSLVAQVPQFPPPLPQPKIRFQAPDEQPPPRRLALPRPEDLGVRPVASVAVPASQVDWNAVRERLQQLGALSFRVDKLAGGNYRVTFLLPTADPRRTRHIETTAATEAAAVQLALERAERVEQAANE